MNTNQNIQYQSLLNQNVGTSMSCDNIDFDTVTGAVVNVDYITCIDLTSSGSINATTGEFLGFLLATQSASSTISRSNNTYVQSDNGNQEYYVDGSPNASLPNYYQLHGNNSGNISFNPNTHRLTTGFLRATDSSTSTMTGGLNVSGLLTATNNSASIVSNSNAVYTVGINTGSYYVPLVSNTGGSGYRTLYNVSSINYNAETDTFYSGNGNFTTGYIQVAHMFQEHLELQLLLYILVVLQEINKQWI